MSPAEQELTREWIEILERHTPGDGAFPTPIAPLVLRRFSSPGETVPGETLPAF